MINIPNEIRQLCEKDSCRKNFRVRFIGGEHEDLTNENILTESVSFTESICSGSLKFGMCESSILTFDCDLSENLKGAEIEAQIEIDISNESPEFIETYGHTAEDVDFPFYPITYGKFKIKECKKNKNGLRSVSAYTKLLGDEQIEAKGTSRVSDFGLSKYEIAQMNLEYTTPNPYVIDLMSFIIGNSDFYDTSDLNLSPAEYHGGTSTTQFSIDVEIELNDGTVTHETHDFITYYKVLYSGVYYVVPNHGNGLDGFNEELTDVLKASNPNIKNTKISNESYSRIGMGKIQNSYASEYLVDPVFIYSHPQLPSISNISFVDYVRLDYSTRIDSVSEYEVYVADLSSFPSIRLEFPRTVSRVVGKTKYYSLDYKALFTDGIEVTTKDKTGATVTRKYTFSYRDMVESFAELQAAFGMYWRNSGGFAMKGLNYPSDKRLSEYVVGTDAIQNGSDYLVSMSCIEDMAYDDELTRPYGKITCTCTPSNETEEQTLVLEMIEEIEKIPTDQYLTYDLSDNYFIKTVPATRETIFGYMQTIADALQGMRYKPCSITCKGIPFVEAGDWVEFATNDGTMLTNVMSQTINGVQALMTTIESEE